MLNLQSRYNTIEKVLDVITRKLYTFEKDAKNRIYSYLYPNIKDLNSYSENKRKKRKKIKRDLEKNKRLLLNSLKKNVSFLQGTLELNEEWKNETLNKINKKEDDFIIVAIINYLLLVNKVIRKEYTTLKELKKAVNKVIEEDVDKKIYISDNNKKINAASLLDKEIRADVKDKLFSVKMKEANNKLTEEDSHVLEGSIDFGDEFFGTSTPILNIDITEDNVNDVIDKIYNEGVFFLCNEFCDCAVDHLDYQAKVYYNKYFRANIKNKIVVNKIEEFIKEKGLYSTQDIADGTITLVLPNGKVRGVYLTTRPNCRHRFTPIETLEAMNTDVHDLLVKHKETTGEFNKKLQELSNKITLCERNIRRYKNYLDTFTMLLAKDTLNKELSSKVHHYKALVLKWQNELNYNKKLYKSLQKENFKV